ncbi:AMP-binding protein [Spirosoma montaniterrae]|uniref:AMP-dependent synthetase n=1 Tax=Spirosoma montaniterrae TaxID=1178516 RepID=A0A1P9WWE9_9BACT|nr:AMP-binding protein [Spirosoma montaniterrae]AQG79715.1 AMP-dependent synthetase [Spirosoma montaniterrae]
METVVRQQSGVKTLVESFYQWEQQRPTNVYLRQPVGDSYIDFTWGEVGQQARRLATYINSLGLPPHSNIGLISKNCAHWIIADIAILISGHVSVPFYPTLTADQLRQVLDHSGCQVLFVGKIDNWEAVKPGVPDGVQGIAFPDYRPNSSAPDPDCRQWDDIMATYEPQTESPLPDPDDLYTIIYTSGTTGNPKGVMMDYASMRNAIAGTKSRLHHDLPETRFFSYLPLCHVAERNIVEATSLATGGTVYFTESLDTFAKNLQAARPTHFLAVPRIWTKLQQGVLAKLPQEKLDRLLKIPIISGLVKKKIRKGLGLNDARLILTGAAPMPASLIRWFRRIGITIQEAYGMTENTGAVSMMPSDQIKDGTVGKLYDGVEVKIDPKTGEVSTRCGWLMRGYYREPALTDAVLKDGWLATGDVGELDSEGYLRITGRVKEMYKSPKGEFIAPAQIEFGFADNTYIEQICVGGQHLPQPVALVVLSETGRTTDRQLVSQSLEQTLRHLNPKLHTYEHVKKVVVVKETWTVDNNLMTPTMKIKRNVIEARYEPKMEPWFQQPEAVIWEE